ncbi:hypothetical protein BDN70DRAFT_697903 [Pholiota conissans]|uniref:Uncharacterized protein n=1 Tax=Pholiota conissans TaxID=109636 RepID=A0A9P6CRW3_9AGAR|nr:hypothetical protein BDN70DRAFT_697903 [Pholiota conissans]
MPLCVKFLLISSPFPHVHPHFSLAWFPELKLYLPIYLPTHLLRRVPSSLNDFIPYHDCYISFKVQRHTVYVLARSPFPIIYIRIIVILTPTKIKTKTKLKYRHKILHVTPQIKRKPKIIR